MLSVLDSGLARELQAILTLYLGTILNGYSFGWSAVAIPNMKYEMSHNGSLSVLPTIRASDEELTWFASVISLSMVPGSLLGGYYGGRVGPKRSVMVASVLAAVSWLTICLSPHLSTLVLGRFINGLSLGFSTANCALLVAQYSSMKFRGGFLSLYTLMLSVGILTAYCLGAFLYWRYVAAIPVILCVLNFCVLLRVPESPLWLLGHAGLDRAREALHWLRQTDQVQEEIIQLQQLMEDQSSGLTMTDALKNLSRSDVRTPFLLVTINYWIAMMSGTPIIVFYSVSIFQEAGAGINKHLASILVASINVIGGIVGIFLVQKLPRVKLNMVATSLMSVCMAALGTALYLKDSLPDSAHLLDWVAVVAVVLYMFSFGAGAGPLIFVYVGELLPREYKVLSGIVSASSNVPLFVLTKMFPSLLQSLSPPGTYWLLASIALSSNIFYYFFMPETRGKTALEIKQMFSKDKN